MQIRDLKRFDCRISECHIREQDGDHVFGVLALGIGYTPVLCFPGK